MKTAGESPLKHLHRLLREDAAGVTNDEGRSQLDFRITELQTAPETVRAAWRKALLKLLTSVGDVPKGWWSSLERFVVLSQLSSSNVGELIEAATSKTKVPPTERANLYALLDACGKPPLAATVAADTELKCTDPLRWLDLMLARVPTAKDAQVLVIDAARNGYFSVPQFVQRLDQMRAIGGAHMREWLETLRKVLRSSDQPAFDHIVGATFGIDNPGHGLPQLVTTVSGRAPARLTPVPPSNPPQLDKATRRNIALVIHARELAQL
jgi:hypothetical protein